MKHKHRIDQLQSGVKSLLAKSGYAFSEEDKAILKSILVELEEMSISEKDNSSNELLTVLSLLLRFLKFFGIDDITKLF